MICVHVKCFVHIFQHARAKIISVFRFLPYFCYIKAAYFSLQIYIDDAYIDCLFSYCFKEFIVIRSSCNDTAP